jgi:hypothetical protein
MEFKKLFATKSSYISNYSKNLRNNYGLDHILDLSTSAGASAHLYSTRILLEFDISSITSTLTSSYTSTLVLYNATNSLLTQENFDVEIYPITEQWNRGSGSKLYPVTSSANYIERTALSSWSASGGTYSPSTSSVVTFIKGNENLTANISGFIEYWETNPNYGLLLKFPSGIESTTANYENHKSFYSTNTHTFFKPSINISYPSTLIKDDSHNLKIGTNNIFFIDKNVSTTSYPGFALLSTDLTLTTATAQIISYYAPYTWYFIFNNQNLIYNEIYKIISNTASNYSVTTSLTSFNQNTSFTNDISRLNANMILQSSYFENEFPILHAKIYDYVYVGMGSVASDYYPSNVYLFFIERNTRTVVTEQIEMNYNTDGYYLKFDMSNLLPMYNYTPILKIVDGINNEYIYKEIPEATFYIKKQQPMNFQ